MFDKQYSDKCLIFRLSISTQFSINLLFAWSQSSFFDEDFHIFRYEIDEVGKNHDKSTEKKNERVIEFYQLIDTIDINQIRFTDIYRFIDWKIDIDFIDWLLRSIYGFQGIEA